MSDTTVTGEPEVEAAPVGELTELARLEIRIGKIVEVGETPEGILERFLVVAQICLWLLVRLAAWIRRVMCCLFIYRTTIITAVYIQIGVLHRTGKRRKRTRKRMRLVPVIVAVPPPCRS